MTALLMVAGALVLTAPSAAAWVPYCGPSTYIHEIRVENWADGHQQISVTPTLSSRVDLDPGSATNDMWHAVQNCVSGLYGARADTVYAQLQCHQHFAIGQPATGPTYDLETWRPTFDPASWFSSHCGNKLGTDPVGPTSGFYRPDAGAVDLEGAFDSFG